MYFDLTETDVTEDLCSTSYYSDGALIKLDGYIYAEQCRNVQRTYEADLLNRDPCSRGIDEYAFFGVERNNVGRV